ncbi:MAG: arginine--tRNA ligase [Candidatus Gottesmanbacteria bacterium]|nr:arginine--tRNA ligase [Candidatus Gottesmanbacteria bacterium]
MKDQIATLIADILKDLGYPEVVVDVQTSEDAIHGDYTTNVAMKIWRSPQTPQTPQSPQFRTPLDLALQVVEQVESRKSKVESEGGDQNIVKRGQKKSAKVSPSNILSAIDRVEAAPPGFINVFLSEASLITSLTRLLKSGEAVTTARNFIGHWDLGFGHSRPSRVMVEFAHPNTHKAFHIGHLRNITTGESIIRLLESQGHDVIRVNYQGDVGMHIAKCLYSLLHEPHQTQMTHVTHASIPEKVEFLGKAYAAGSKAFEDDPAAKEEIVGLNALIYAAAQRLACEKGIDPGTTDYLALVKPEYTDRLDAVYTLWKETRQWSLDYFETIYKRVGTRYDRYYFESECLAGVDLARDAVLKGVLKEDAGAIILDGKPYGIDTRVFINSKGLPTYEGKELKLSTMETTEFGKRDRIIHVVGGEQASFFQVTFKAEERLGIVKPGVQYHLIYGWVKLKHGKMSSRSGNVVLGEWLLDEAKKSIYTILDKSDVKDKEEIAEKAAVAAVKYAFLRVGTLSEIAFDLATSISFDGDSGPYLQYTYARCKSVMRKAGVTPNLPKSPNYPNLNPEERALARLLSFFPDVVEDSANNLSPSTLCTYLFKLAAAFNVFYAKHQILGKQEEFLKIDTLDVLEFERGGLDTLKNQDVKTSKRLDQEPPPSTFKVSNFRLSLTAATAQVLSHGLYLLGIETLEQM